MIFLNQALNILEWNVYFTSKMRLIKISKILCKIKINRENSSTFIDIKRQNIKSEKFLRVKKYEKFEIDIETIKKYKVAKRINQLILKRRRKNVRK